MPSITTQNVASASAALVPQSSTVTQSAQSQAAASPQNIMRATQVASAEQTHRNKRRDEQRGVQLPKRAEGSFAGQTQYTRSKKKAAQSEERHQPDSGDPGTDIVA